MGRWVSNCRRLWKRGIPDGQATDVSAGGVFQNHGEAGLLVMLQRADASFLSGQLTRS